MRAYLLGRFRPRLAYLMEQYRPHLAIAAALVVLAVLWTVIGLVGYGLWQLGLALLDWLVGVIA